MSKTTSQNLYRSTVVYIVAVFLMAAGFALYLFIDIFELSSALVTLGVLLLPVAYTLRGRAT